MDFLSENSKRHLEEVLEYLESLGIPYIINNGLIGNRAYCSETIFAIVDSDTKSKQKILAIGERYTGLGKRIGLKKDIHGVGISLLIKNQKAGLRDSIKKIKKPIASFMQLGIESKLLSLSVIESLRKVKIPLYLSLAKDRLGAQVSNIEKYHTPYLIVMGKKEAVDKTVIVRKVDIHSQDIVSLSDLPAHMKKIEEKHLKSTK
jgi:histidyl-tRNA synthetase